MSQTLLSFEIDPYQIRHYSDSASLAALHTRHQDYLSGWDFPFRVISRSFPADLAPIRTVLRHRADDLLDLADVLLVLQQHAAGQAEAADVASAVRQRSTALRRVLGEHPEAARCFRVLEVLAQGQAPASAIAWLYGVAQPLVWRWRWLTNQQVMLDVIERELPPLALAHHLLIWPERRRDAALFETSVRDRMLLPDVVAAPLPRLFPCRYREQGTLLEPLERGYDYLAILTAYELPPHPWGYDNVWNKLLMGDFP
ncbi:MAG TPA: hypothetical protein VFS21_33965, partial [Roseiflexaceae bacterium]|nr:hypothetical protein [Roseiflexaceae bacterium]